MVVLMLMCHGQRLGDDTGHVIRQNLQSCDAGQARP
jgi:hypothetical protein